MRNYVRRLVSIDWHRPWKALGPSGSKPAGAARDERISVTLHAVNSQKLVELARLSNSSPAEAATNALMVFAFGRYGLAQWRAQNGSLCARKQSANITPSDGTALVLNLVVPAALHDTLSALAARAATPTNQLASLAVTLAVSGHLGGHATETLPLVTE